jgi:hypothetical protein
MKPAILALLCMSLFVLGCPSAEKHKSPGRSRLSELAVMNGGIFHEHAHVSIYGSSYKLKPEAFAWEEITATDGEGHVLPVVNRRVTLRTKVGPMASFSVNVKDAVSPVDVVADFTYEGEAFNISGRFVVKTGIRGERVWNAKRMVISPGRGESESE